MDPMGGHCRVVQTEKLWDESHSILHIFEACALLTSFDHISHALELHYSRRATSPKITYRGLAHLEIEAGYPEKQAPIPIPL